MIELPDTVTILKTDYTDYGGEIEKWEIPDEDYPDCSVGCKWFASTGDGFGICKKPDGPRESLLTFKHQAGKDCFEY